MRMKKISRIVILIILVLSGIFTYKLKDLGFDYDYEKFFPKENKQMETFVEFRKKYGSDSDFLLIGIERREGILNSQFLNNVKSFGDSLLKCELIQRVISPVHEAKFYKQSMLSGLEERDYVDLNKSTYDKKDSLQLFSNPLFIGSILPKKGNSLCLFVQTDEHLSKAKANKILNLIETELKRYAFEKVHKSGRIIAQTYYVKKMLLELLIFISSSVVLLTLFLYISFKSLWGVVIPLFVVIISTIWTMALMYFTGKSFDLLMMMLPTIIFVVGMSDLVHLLSKYIEELRSGKPKLEALKIAFKEVRWATFLTSFTTAIGFFALLTSNVQPIQEFGLYAGLGVFVAYFLAFTLLPSVLYLSKEPNKILESKSGVFWNKLLHKLFLWVLKYQKKILIAVVFLAGLGIYSASQIQVNNFLLEDLSDSDPVKQDVMFFEQNYSGVRPFEMILETSHEEGILNYEVIKEVEKVQSYLKKSYTSEGVGFVISPITILEEVNFMKHNSKAKYRRLPDTKRRYNSLLRQTKRWSEKMAMIKNSAFEDLLINKEKSGRITGKISDVGGLSIKEENKRLDDFLAANIDADLLQVKLTGTAMLIDENNSHLALNLIKGLLMAFLIIAVIVGLMFRSIKLAFLTLLPNILPLLMVTFVMWIGGIDLKISTSLIFTLAFGIAVDDTIHLLAKYKLEMKKGRSHVMALKRSYLSSGKAIIVTSLILIGGFLTLMFSSFASTFYMGLLVSVTLVLAVVLDLLIMPMIILYAGKK